MTTQKSVFLAGEGDRWYRRNQSALLSEAVPEGIRCFARHAKAGERVLEIGCGNGVRLNQIRSLIPCECVGIDPSSEAIREGRDSFPGVRLEVGTADSLNYPDGIFDFVIFGFCLYLVDRHLLTRVVAEADRVLKDHGRIGITDFDSPIPVKRPYAHREGIWTYKADYGALFCAFPHFVLIEKISYSHQGPGFTFDLNERVASWVIGKDLSAHWGDR